MPSSGPVPLVVTADVARAAVEGHRRVDPVVDRRLVEMLCDRIPGVIVGLVEQYRTSMGLS